MLRRRVTSLGITFVVMAAIAVACGDDPGTSPDGGDSGSPLGVLGDSVCPKTAPDAGEACVLPEGTTCAFGACGSPIARCSLGAWRYSGNPQPRPQCPTDFPVPESACPPCWTAGVECTYGTCSGPDASANTTVASCVDAGAERPATWNLRSFSCGGSDAGADVQGDAAPDAD